MSDTVSPAGLFAPLCGPGEVSVGATGCASLVSLKTSTVEAVTG